MVATQDVKINTLNQLDKTDLRLLLSSFYLQGQGLEVGALHQPLQLTSKAKVKYVDRLPVSELRIHYSDLSHLDLVDVNIIDDGERLVTIANGSQDFIVANHMLEHCVNPIQTLQTFSDKLKPSGIIYISIPDKRFCFDKDRELTSFDHLTDDYYCKNEHFQHYIEWTRYVNGVTDEQEIQRQAHHLFQMQYSIHFHVWDYFTFVDFIQRMNAFLNYRFDVLNISFDDYRHEIITILRRRVAWCKKIP
jgi:predicted SAM-dependent methyltransferase